MHMSGTELRKRKAEPNDSETCHSAIDFPHLFSSSIGKVGIYNTTLDLHLHPNPFCHVQYVQLNCSAPICPAQLFFKIPPNGRNDCPSIYPQASLNLSVPYYITPTARPTRSPRFAGQP
jgi:hypothetical protein